MKNRNLQALEQISGILASLDPDSYIATTLKKGFSVPQSGQGDSQVAGAFAGAADQREVLQHQLVKTGVQVEALKATYTT